MKYYLVGIKGTGMASLAKLLKDWGHFVIGSDVDDDYFTVNALKEAHIPLLSFDEKNITDDFFYIIGNAFDEANIEVQTIFKKNYRYLYYHEFIGQNLPFKIIACSGTHGKTTTAYLLTNFLGKKCNYIIGDGEGGGYNSNLLVLEACEYKEHFLSYFPEILIINNIELDHTDYYKSKKQLINAFQKVAKQAKIILVNGDDKNARKIKHPHKITFGFKTKNDATIKILSTTSNGYYIKLKYQNNNYFKVPYLGKHMIYNYVAGYLATKILGYEPRLNHQQLPKKRLMSKKYKNALIIDDYAHHPTEIKALYETLSLTYPNKKINVIFQPHTYERTLHFKRDFKRALKLFDVVYVMDVFTSKRESKSIALQKKVNKVFKKFNKIDKLVIDQIGALDEIWLFLGAGLASDLINQLPDENVK